MEPAIPGRVSAESPVGETGWGALRDAPHGRLTRGSDRSHGREKVKTNDVTQARLPACAAPNVD